MKRRSIMLGSAVAVIAGLAFWLSDRSISSDTGDAMDRPVGGGTAYLEKKDFSRLPVREESAIDEPRGDDGRATVIDPLFALPTDAESWQLAVENYSQADDDAYLERGYIRFAAAKYCQAVEAAPVNAGDRRRLRDLLMSKELAKIDLGVAAKKSGVVRRGPGFDAWVAAERARIDGEIKALVGTTYFSEMEAMSRFRGIRLLGINLLGETYVRGIPLSDEQIEGMNQIMPSRSGREMKLPINPSTGLSAYDEKFLADTKNLLSAEQRDVFRRMRIEENLYDSAMALKKQRQEAAKASGEAEK
jgi:hypothetical protein